MSTNLMQTCVGDAGATVAAPLVIPNLLYWFDANKETFQNTGLTTPASANNDPVGGWKDQSGNGLHATQSTNSARPLLQTNQQNGLKTILGDGNTQLLNFTTTAEFNDTTWFIVLKYVTFGGFLSGGLADGGTPGLRFRTAFSPGDTMSITSTAGSTELGLNVGLDTTVYQISFSLITSGSSTMSHYLNGSSNGSGAYGGGAISHNMVFSRDAATPGNVYIGEIGAYSRSLSSTELNSLYTYLHTKWSI